MKTRENELHEPIIKTEEPIYKDGYWAIARCSVCKNYLGLRNGTTMRLEILHCKKYIPNYCLNCGARLKEAR